jgi:hypothetical protein
MRPWRQPELLQARTSAAALFGVPRWRRAKANRDGIFFPGSESSGYLGRYIPECAKSGTIDACGEGWYSLIHVGFPNGATRCNWARPASPRWGSNLRPTGPKGDNAALTVAQADAGIRVSRPWCPVVVENVDRGTPATRWPPAFPRSCAGNRNL